MKREGRRKPLLGGSPKISILDKKKTTKRIAKFLHMRCRYLLQKLQGRSRPRDLSSVQKLLVPEHNGVYTIVIFFVCFYKETYKRRSCLQVFFFRTSHFREIVGSCISSNSYKTATHPLLTTSSEQHFAFPSQRSEARSLYWDILYICSSDLCIHTGISLLEHA